MNALVSKEIRLLLPVFGVALLLASLPMWLLPPSDARSFFADAAIYLFGFGAILLAVGSFGREFNLNTFQVLLAQPLERHRVWWTKISVLFTAMAAVFAVWLLSRLTLVQYQYDPASHYFIGSRYANSPAPPPYDWQADLARSATIILVLFSGGLWTTLLLRQVSAAFWFTILLPATFAMLVDVFGGSDTTVVITMILYSAAGFWLARKLFMHAQEVPWSGVTIDLPGFAATTAVSQERRRNPWLALVRAELRLQQVSLISIVALFAVHLCTLFFVSSDNMSVSRAAQAVADLCVLLWFVIPVMVGATSVAEERKLGTMESRLCLPVSARKQFILKLLITILIGGVLTALLFGIRGRLDPHIKSALLDFYGELRAANTIGLFVMATLFLSVPFSVIAGLSFYGSTLSRNFIQSLMSGIITIILTVALCYAAIAFSLDGVGILPWRNTPLVYFIGVPVMFLVWLRLSFRNFRRLIEPGRLWRRNLLAIACGILFSGTVTAGIYNRVWETLTPIESAHGPARIKADKPVRLHPAHQDGGAIVIVLPDGRLWQSRFYFEGIRSIPLFQWHDKWTSLAGNHFVDGTNWVDAVDAFSSTFAIRNDGSLWSSKEPHRDYMGEVQAMLSANPSLVTNRAALRSNIDLSLLLRDRFTADPPDKLVQYGVASDWKGLTALVNGTMLALTKTNGSVWNGFPAGNGNAPTRFIAAMNGFEMMAVPSKLSGSYTAYWWDKQGNARTGLSRDSSIRWPPLDQTHWRCIVEWFPNWPYWMPLHAGVRDDGSLWCWQGPFPNLQHSIMNNLIRIGVDSDWASIAGDSRSLFGLKNDGSLWMWLLEPRRHPNSPSQAFAIPSGTEPVQLGTHRDWLAVCNGAPGMSGAIALAADGNLWWWRSQDPYPPFGGGSFLTAPSKKPLKLGNIFGQE